MTKLIALMETILEAKANVSEHSTLFYWMVSNHDQLNEKAGHERISWVRLSRVFAEAGLTDMTGKPPATNTARQTWRRARAFVAAERQRLATGQETAAKQAEVSATPPPRTPTGIVPITVPSPVEASTPPGLPTVVRQPDPNGRFAAMLENSRLSEAGKKTLAGIAAELEELDEKTFRWGGG